MDPAVLAAVQEAPASEAAYADGPSPDPNDTPETWRTASVLLRMPYTLPFDSRLRVLRRWLGADREDRLASLLMGVPPHVITVRRDQLLGDAHAALKGTGLQLRSPLRVRFLGQDNLEEAGIGEGVAKEFLVDVLKAGFDPALGLFLATPDGTLYPNPAAPLRVPDALAMFEFLGAILAKVLYEGILVDLPLAPFFVSRLLGRTNTVADMPALDATLFQSLMFVKRCASCAHAPCTALPARPCLLRGMRARIIGGFAPSHLPFTSPPVTLVSQIRRRAGGARTHICPRAVHRPRAAASREATGGTQAKRRGACGHRVQPPRVRLPGLALPAEHAAAQAMRRLPSRLLGGGPIGLGGHVLPC